MIYYCTLEKDINICPYYNKEKETCGKESPCSFGVEEGNSYSSDQQQNAREERWYEKYYRK